MKKIFSIAALALAVLSQSCKKDLQFKDPTANGLSNEDALAIKGVGIKITNSAVVNALIVAYGDLGNSGFGVQLACYADQITTTNRFNEFWDFAQEPRLAFNNSETYNGYGVVRNYYNNLYQINLDANKVIEAANSGTPIVSATGANRTLDSKAAAFFAKGIAQGYLGTIFDRGAIIDNAAQQAEGIKEFTVSYKDMIASGVKFLDSAIATANANTNFNFDFIPGQTVTKAQFIALCNSFAARILASTARDLAEAKALGNTFWAKVLAYANAGVTSDILNVYTNGGFYHGTLDWGVFLLSDGAGYLPIDIKIPHLADASGNTPNYYPAAPTVLGPITSNDARFNQYFGYTPNFGFLRADRNRGLFTNYYRVRWDNVDNTVVVPGAITPLFLAEEVRYLKAEAQMFSGDFNGAAATLNAPASRRKAIGTLPDVAANEAALRRALHYEYSIEIDLAAGAQPVWAMMRRNNLLIGGTPTEMPIPQQQLNVLKIPVYTNGGKVNFGAKGKFNEVATADNVGWKASQ
jgi:hypothetical protein